jgi:type II secretory pathway component PulK
LINGILDWRGTNGPGSTESSYEMLQPAYQCKNAPFESVDELRMVYGADMDLLVGEDANRNGVLDPNENDENQNGMLDSGILEHVTVYTREPNPTNSSTMVNISSLSSTSDGPLTSLLTTNFGSARANQILQSLGLGTAGAASSRTGATAAPGTGRTGTGATPPTATATVAFSSPLQFYVRSGMTSSEFAQVFTNLTTTNSPYLTGRVNVNTASAPVLACLLDGDLDAAQQLVNYRSANPNGLTSIAWVIDALGQSYASDLTALEAGDYITTQSYQFSADVAALGPYGRGYRRVRFVFDTSSGTPKIIYRQDLTHLGWALGKDLRQNWVLAKGTK